jgi:hypothetical protein
MLGSGSCSRHRRPLPRWQTPSSRPAVVGAGTAFAAPVTDGQGDEMVNSQSVGSTQKFMLCNESATTRRPTPVPSGPGSARPDLRLVVRWCRRSRRVRCRSRGRQWRSGMVVSVPSTAAIRSPSAASCARRPTRTRNVTSVPASARRAPKYPPTAPAPTTRTRTTVGLSSRTGAAR